MSVFAGLILLAVGLLLGFVIGEEWQKDEISLFLKALHKMAEGPPLLSGDGPPDLDARIWGDVGRRFEASIMLGGESAALAHVMRLAQLSGAQDAQDAWIMNRACGRIR